MLWLQSRLPLYARRMGLLLHAWRWGLNCSVEFAGSILRHNDGVKKSCRGLDMYSKSLVGFNVAEYVALSLVAGAFRPNLIP